MLRMLGISFAQVMITLVQVGIQAAICKEGPTFLSIHKIPMFHWHIRINSAYVLCTNILLTFEHLDNTFMI